MTVGVLPVLGFAKECVVMDGQIYLGKSKLTQPLVPQEMTQVTGRQINETETLKLAVLRFLLVSI